jgi:spore coat protein U-like protein
MIKASLALLLFLITSSSYSRPINCKLRLSVNNISLTWTGRKEVYTGSISISRGVRSRRCRHFIIGLSKGNAGNYNRKAFRRRRTINYNLFKNNSVNTPLKEIRDANNRDEYIEVSFNNNERFSSVNFEARIPFPNNGLTFPAAGTFSDTLQATIGSRRHDVKEVSTSMRLSIYVAPAIDISFVSTGSPFDGNATNYSLDFGEIRQGKSQKLDLRVKSNAGYRVFIVSQNAGRLKHESSTSTSTIGYDFKRNGASFSLTRGTPTRLASFNGITSDQGNQIGLEFIMKSADQKTAGNYQDTITVTAMSNN